MIKNRPAVILELDRLAHKVLTESDADDARVSSPIFFGLGPQLKIWWDRRELRSLEFTYATQKNSPDYIYFKAHYDRAIPVGFKLIGRNSVLAEKLGPTKDETKTGITQIDEVYSSSGNISLITRLLLDSSLYNSSWVWTIDILSSKVNDIVGIMGTNGAVHPEKSEEIFNFVLELAMKALS